MDNVTHTLFGLTLARTPLARAGRGTTAALILASNAPDIDIVTALPGGFVTYLRWHRGPTHGPIGVVTLGLTTALLVWGFDRVVRGRRARAPDGPESRASFVMLAAVSMIGVLCHVLMDLPTSYGTRLVSPFDWHWFAVDWMPIVDIYLLAVLAAGLLFGRGSMSARRRNAALALALMGVNYGVRAAAHHQALVIAPRLFGPTLPQRCADASPATSVIDEWPMASSAGATESAAHRCLVEIAAMPTFFSPFSWRLIARFSNAYEVHDVDLLDARFRTPASSAEAFWRRAVRYPNIWSDAAVRAASTRSAQVFLGFSRFPAARSFTDSAGTATVRFTDIRFVSSGFVDEVRRSDPFTVIVRTTADGRVTTEAFGR
ncbi:MAG TPA: metal-dependent hydrolase [Vicinamibacterales bacterium]|nr:metal-dependent hydrolase [Vicinamibacterales bacterium]